MKVLNLQCTHGHAFEGWFGSEEDFQSQHARGIVECPLCGDKEITKGLTAPRLNLGAREVVEGKPAQAAAPAPSVPAMTVEAQAAYLKAVRHIIANTEDVGEHFAEEARRIHYGETPERDIRGQASPEEARELIDEGIQVGALLVPEALKGPLQ